MSEIERNIVVSANPGTGKTEFIANTVISYLDRGISSKDILCLTFTRKARDEMEERIAGKISSANKNYDVPMVETFHSFALSIITDGGRNINTLPERFMRHMIINSMVSRKLMNYSPEYLNGKFPGIVNVGGLTNAIKLLKSYGIYPNLVNVDEILESINLLYEKGKGLKEYSKEEMLTFARKFYDIYIDYENIKGKKFLDYNDYIEKALERIKSGFRKFPYVFVDELQDISERERELIISSGEKFVLVGDSKQAIFGFQGGNSKSFNNFVIDPGFESLEMKESRRVPELITRYSVEFFTRVNKGNVGNELLHMEGAKLHGPGSVTILYSKKEGDVPDALTKTVKEIYAKMGDDETLGIITRTNAQAENISTKLITSKVPFSKLSGSGVSIKCREEIITFLKGVILQREVDIIPMLYTKYSELPFKDAVELADKIRFEKNPGEFLPDHLKELRKKFGSQPENIIKLFEEWIMPRGMKISMEAFETARDIYSTLPFYLDFKGKDNFSTMDDLLTYIDQDNSTDEIPIDATRITLLTAHKAKGLEFDHVIYMPKYSRGERKSPVDLVVELTLNQFSHSYNSEDKELEENRIDFVAITRPKKTLTIVTSDKQIERYRSEIAVEIPYSPGVRGGDNEFISMDRMKSQMEKPEPWLINNIKTKMKKFNNLSYTMMSNLSSDELENFVITYLLGIRITMHAMEFGTQIHEYIERYIKENEKPETMMDDDLINTWKNFAEYDQLIRNTYHGKWIHSELSMKKTLPVVFPSLNEAFSLTGKIDGVYTYMDGTVEKHVVVDFKTSKKPSPGYVDQLALYSRLYSLEKSLDPSRIETEIAYIALREERVNIGKWHWKNERVPHEIQKRALENIEKYVKSFVNYRNSVEAFIRDILSIKGNSEIFAAFKEEIEKEMGNST